MIRDSDRALFLGSKQLGLKALQAMVDAIPGRVAAVITLDDSKDTRSRLPAFRTYCRNVGIPLSVVHGPKDLGAVVQQHAPRYVLVAGWYWVIKPSLLDAIPGGVVGLHPSLLPKYRGSAPLVWAVLRGEAQTGVSLFYLDHGLDTGDIVDQVAFPIHEHQSIADVLANAENAGLELVRTYAAPLLSGTAPRRQQDHDLASYGSLRRPEDGLIAWNEPARSVQNFIRAQTRPYPGAFTYSSEGHVLRIWAASLFPHPYYGVPGLVGQTCGEGVVVGCGEGAVVVRECELADGTVIPPTVVLKWGIRLSVDPMPAGLIKARVS